jgi:hypothetical protein
MLSQIGELKNLSADSFSKAACTHKMFHDINQDANFIRNLRP